MKTPALRSKFNSNLEKNYLQRSYSMERPLSPGSPEVFTPTKKQTLGGSNGVPFIKAPVTPTTRFTAASKSFAVESTTPTSSVSSPFFPLDSSKGSSSSSASRFGFFPTVATSTTDTTPTAPASNASGSTKERSLSRSSSSESSATSTSEAEQNKEAMKAILAEIANSVKKTNGSSDDVIMGRNMDDDGGKEDGKIRIPPTHFDPAKIAGPLCEEEEDEEAKETQTQHQRPSTIFEEESDSNAPDKNEGVISTDDYVRQAIDPLHESQVLDSLERECLENLASLKMTWTPSKDDVIRDLCPT